MAYHPEELDGIDAMHKDGRLMPFIEFPLIGGKTVLRLMREGDAYVVKIPAETATEILRDINQACWDAGLHYE